MIETAYPLAHTSPDLFARFIARISPSADGKCWEWRGWINKTTGYGYLWAIGKPRKALLAHRVSHEFSHGPIPPGLVIDHLCRNRACVRPDHIEAVTDRVNVVVRCTTSFSAINARKTHCPQGHEYTADNIYRDNGSRKCRLCCLAKQRRIRERRAAHRDDCFPRRKA